MFKNSMPFHLAGAILCVPYSLWHCYACACFAWIAPNPTSVFCRTFEVSQHPSPWTDCSASCIFSVSILSDLLPVLGRQVESHYLLCWYPLCSKALFLPRRGFATESLDICCGVTVWSIHCDPSRWWTLTMYKEAGLLDGKAQKKSITPESICNS